MLDLIAQLLSSHFTHVRRHLSSRMPPHSAAHSDFELFWVNFGIFSPPCLTPSLCLPLSSIKLGMWNTELEWFLPQTQESVFHFFFSFLINTDESTPITRHSYSRPQIYATTIIPPNWTIKREKHRTFIDVPVQSAVRMRRYTKYL